MTEIYFNWKIVDLQKECKRFKLSYSGKKSDLIKRLKAYLKNTQPDEQNLDAETESNSESVVLVDVNIAVPSSVTNKDSAEESEEIENPDIVNENGKRIRHVYLKDADFESVELAKKRIDEDGFWKYLRSRFTRDGLKEIYYCNGGKNCKKIIYILFHSDDTSVSIWSNNVDHDHLDDKSGKGINEVTKKTIEMLNKSSVNTATRIKYEMPMKYNKDPIAPKAKVGRTANAKKCLVRQ